MLFCDEELERVEGIPFRGVIGGLGRLEAETARWRPSLKHASEILRTHFEFDPAFDKCKGTRDWHVRHRSRSKLALTNRRCDSSSTIVAEIRVFWDDDNLSLFTKEI